MKKTLIIITHPDINNLVINKRWLQELEKFPEKFHINRNVLKLEAEAR